MTVASGFFFIVFIYFWARDDPLEYNTISSYVSTVLSFSEE
jgi:hypothetical protein